MIGMADRAGRRRQHQLAGCPPRLTHGGHHANLAYRPRPGHPDDRHCLRPRGRPGPRPHDRRGPGRIHGRGQRRAQPVHHARLTQASALPGDLVGLGRPGVSAYHASIACAGTGAPPINQSAARRRGLALVSVGVKRGTMTLGKPGIGGRASSLAYRRSHRVAFSTADSSTNCCRANRY
jgi:hypothetical protein